MKLLNYIFLVGLALWLCACDDDEVKVTPALSFKEKAVTIAEDTGYVEIPLVLTTATETNTAVFVQIEEGSITGGRQGSFCICPSYVILEAGAVRGSIPLQIIDNDYPNENCSFVLRITQVTGGAVAAAENLSCQVTIADDDSKQKVSIGFDTVRLATGEDVGVLEVPVTVKGLLSDFLSFTVEATDGTAISTGEDWDYQLLTPEVKIVEGESWGVVNIAVKDGKALKEDRGFQLKITGVHGIAEGDSTVAIRPENSVCDVTIQKVIRKVMFADSVIIVGEANANGIDLGVKLTAPVDQNITVTIQAKTNSTAVEGVHYKIASKQLTINRGDVLGTTRITVMDDTVGNVNRFCDFEIVEVSGDLEIAENTASKVVFDNDDSSVGFESTDEYTLKGRKLILPIQLAGLHDKRVVLDLEAVVSGEVKELTHFMILNKKLEIAEGDSVVNAEVQIMYPAGEESFEFGVRIAKITVEGLFNKVYQEEGRQLCHIQVGGFSYTKMNMATAVVKAEASSDSPVGESGHGGVAASMIDDNPSTYWHSAWKDGDNYQDESKPYEIVLEFDREYTFGKMLMLRRPSNSDTQGATIEVSKDKLHWKTIFDFNGFPETVGNNGSSGELSPEFFYSGKYVRVIPKANTKNVASIAELYLWSVD